MAESLLQLSSVNGQRFGYLTALEAAEYSPFSRSKRTKERQWLFICDCGVEKTLPLAEVRNGSIRDCGCVEVENTRKVLLPDDDRLAVHRGYITQTVPTTDILGVQSFERQTINLAPTAIDDWINEGVFDWFHISVIERCRDYWRDISRPVHDAFDSDDPESREDSFYSERAKNLFRNAKRHVGKVRWDMFENIVRWNEPSGRCGSRLMTVSVRSIEAAQQLVMDVTEEIGRARIL